MQEGIFGILKRLTRNAYVPLHQLPDFIYECMEKARQAYEVRMNSEYAAFNETNTLQCVSNAGCDTLIEKCREFLTREGYMLFLKELVVAVTGYDVQQISMAEAVDDCRNLMQERNSRGASASHFLCLLKEMNGRNNTYTFKVTARTGSEDPFDIVLVSDNGSFACTHAHFAQMGSPSRHILAVFAAKYCAINVLQHFHPRYLRKVSNPAAGSNSQPREIASMQVTDVLTLGLAQPANFGSRAARAGYMAPAITRSTSYKWALDRARERVQLDILGEHANYVEDQSRPMEEGQKQSQKQSKKRKRNAAAATTGAAKKAKKAPPAVFVVPGTNKQVRQPALQRSAGRNSARKKSLVEKLRRQSRSKSV